MMRNLRLLNLFITFSIVMTACIIFIPSNAEASVNYEQSYYDPYDDIQLVAQEGHFVTGSQWKDLDISQMNLKSETIVTGVPPLTIETTEISMSVTVRGTVKDESKYIYGVYLTVNSEAYTLIYKDKIPLGVNMDTEEKFTPTVEGIGTSTITFKVEESQIGSPKSAYNWNAIAIERSDDGNFGDIAPNKLIKIIDPWDRSLVYGTIVIKGVTRSSLVTYEKVEIQLDSKSGSNWKTVTDKGGWKTWEYSLDTTLFSEIEHSIYVRATDSDGKTHFDDIMFTIDQESKDNPASTDMKPSPHIGDKYVFELSSAGEDAPEMINIDISTTSNMEASVVGQNIEVNSYDCWKMTTSQTGKLNIGGVVFNFETDVEIFLEDSNFDIAKEDSTIKITSGITTPQEQHKISEYSPPKLHYDFPVEVSSEWYGTTDVTINLDGDSSVDTLNIEYKCLFQDSLLSVPGGDFEIYAIRSQNDDASFYKVEFYAPEIGYPVRIETFDIDDNLIGVLVLSDYDIKDTFIEFSAEIELETEGEEGKVYVGDNMDFKVKVKNNGIGKADNALVIGYYKNVGSTEDKTEFAREEVELESKSEKTVTLSLQINESGTYEISFISLSDKSDSVLDNEMEYDEEVTVLHKTTNGESSLSTISTNTMIMGGVVIAVASLIIILLISRKKKETPEFQFVTVEAVEVDEEPAEDHSVVELVEEVTVANVEIEDEGGDNGGEESEKEYQCPACEVELGGDELECPECKVVFEEYLAGLGEDEPTEADELLGETIMDE